MLKKAALFVVSTLTGLLLAEGLLRLLYPDTQQLYVWQPNLQHTFYPDSSVLYGIYGPARFSINAQGFRGSGFKNDGTKKYLCIGGSTTECLYLDDTETWTALLQDSLNTRAGSHAYTIGSIGKSGCTTRENYIQLKYYVPQLGKIDGVIMMVGINDLMKRLSRDTLFENNFAFTPAVEDSFVNTIFLKHSRSNSTTWWRRTALFGLLQQALHKAQPVAGENVQDDKGEIYRQWRHHRSTGKILPRSNYDIGTALNEYIRNLQAIYTEAQRQGITLVLVSQPSLYSLSPGYDENEYLWMGGVGDYQNQPGCAYHPVSTLKSMMLDYNLQLKNFCTGKPGIKFIDVATGMNGDTSVMYDDCHFTEKGARRVAGTISEQL
jgi:hypothetical protein